MGKFFNYENGLFQGLNKITDYILLSFLWIIFSTPIVTIGASTSALYYTVNKVLRHDRSHVWREFWRSFKTNFKQSTITWLILCAAYIITFLNFRYASIMAGQSTMMLIASEVCLSVFLVLMIWSLYLFPYISRFVCTFKDYLKNSFLISIHNLYWSILLLLISAIVLFVLYLFPILIFIVPSGLMRIHNQILEHVFRKYMSQEDLEAEDAYNQEEVD